MRIKEKDEIEGISEYNTYVSKNKKCFLCHKKIKPRKKTIYTRGNDENRIHIICYLKLLKKEIEEITNRLSDRNTVLEWN